MGAPSRRRASRLAMAAVLVVATAGAASAGQWFRDGQRLPDQPWSKSEGDFGAMIVLSAEPEEFLARWSRPTPGVSIRATGSVRRGVPLAPFILFIGCREGAAGVCSASFDLEVLKPDGTSFFRTDRLELWRGKPAPPAGALGLSIGYAEIEIGPTIPSGATSCGRASATSSPGSPCPWSRPSTRSAPCEP